MLPLIFCRVYSDDGSVHTEEDNQQINLAAKDKWRIPIIFGRIVDGKHLCEADARIWQGFVQNINNQDVMTSIAKALTTETSVNAVFGESEKRDVPAKTPFPKPLQQLPPRSPSFKSSNSTPAVTPGGTPAGSPSARGSFTGTTGGAGSIAAMMAAASSSSSEGAAADTTTSATATATAGCAVFVRSSSSGARLDELDQQASMAHNVKIKRKNSNTGGGTHGALYTSQDNNSCRPPLNDSASASSLQSHLHRPHSASPPSSVHIMHNSSSNSTDRGTNNGNGGAAARRGSSSSTEFGEYSLGQCSDTTAGESMNMMENEHFGASAAAAVSAIFTSVRGSSAGASTGAAGSARESSSTSPMRATHANVEAASDSALNSSTSNANSNDSNNGNGTNTNSSSNSVNNRSASTSPNPSGRRSPAVLQMLGLAPSNNKVVPLY